MNYRHDPVAVDVENEARIIFKNKFVLIIRK